MQIDFDRRSLVKSDFFIFQKSIEYSVFSMVFLYLTGGAGSFLAFRLQLGPKHFWLVWPQFFVQFLENWNFLQIWEKFDSTSTLRIKKETIRPSFGVSWFYKIVLFNLTAQKCSGDWWRQIHTKFCDVNFFKIFDFFYLKISQQPPCVLSSCLKKEKPSVDLLDISILLERSPKLWYLGLACKKVISISTETQKTLNF